MLSVNNKIIDEIKAIGLKIQWIGEELRISGISAIENGKDKVYEILKRNGFVGYIFVSNDFMDLIL